MPKYATNYAGPNANFRQTLIQYQNTAQIGLREAIGNRLTVTVESGTLERDYPIQIRATNNQGLFTVTGGLGCVPVTFTGLSGYRAPVLEAKIGGHWTPVNQAVHGNAYWQCDYQAEQRAWDITFTLQLEGSNYQDLNSLRRNPHRHDYRFQLIPKTNNP